MIAIVSYFISIYVGTWPTHHKGSIAQGKGTGHMKRQKKKHIQTNLEHMVTTCYNLFGSEKCLNMGMMINYDT